MTVIDAEIPRATVRKALRDAADPALRAWIDANAEAFNAATRIGPFSLYSDADFEALDALLLEEVIKAVLEYSRTRDWHATTTAEAKRANEGLDRAKTLLAFMTLDNDIRQWLTDMDVGSSDLLNAANGFRPHNAMSLPLLRAELQAKLPGAIARARSR